VQREKLTKQSIIYFNLFQNVENISAVDERSNAIELLYPADTV